MEPTIEQIICRKIERMTGKPVEIGTLDLLKILTHPDVIDLTIRMIKEKEMEGK